MNPTARFRKKKGVQREVKFPLSIAVTLKGDSNPHFTLFAPDKSSSFPYGVRTGIIRE